MTTTPLPPSYGIWTTDADGNRVMGFTPEQFLSVWQSRADLEAKNAKLREALENLADEFMRVYPIYYYAEPWAHDRNVPLKMARAALKETP